MTDHEQRRRREQFLQGGKDTQERWEREIASPDGPLPGAALMCWSTPAVRPRTVTQRARITESEPEPRSLSGSPGGAGLLDVGCWDSGYATALAELGLCAWSP
jgi:hypothetical protein